MTRQEADKQIDHAAKVFSRKDPVSMDERDAWFQNVKYYSVSQIEDAINEAYSEPHGYKMPVDRIIAIAKHIKMDDDLTVREVIAANSGFKPCALCNNTGILVIEFKQKGIANKPDYYEYGFRCLCEWGDLVASRIPQAKSGMFKNRVKRELDGAWVINDGVERPGMKRDAFAKAAALVNEFKASRPSRASGGVLSDLLSE